MAKYIVANQGATIRKVDERLVVTKDRRVLETIPLHDLDQLVVMGDVQITTQAHIALMKADVDLAFMTRGGRIYRPGGESNRAELRLRQYQLMNDPAANLALAKGIVYGKLTNQLALLQRAITAASASASAGDEAQLSLVPKTKRAAEIVDARAYGTAIRGIREMLALSVHATDADSLRGYEGKAGAWYWPAFKLFLSNDMGFTQRRYHPSTDPINALLSFGYSLLQRDVTAVVKLVGLDLYLGFFHTVQYNRPSLALDLMEEFRPVLVDPVVIRLVNLGMIKERDFVRGAERGAERGADQEHPLMMTSSAVKRVIEAYEARASTLTPYPSLVEPVSFRQCIELQARHLVRVIKGEEMAYQPFIVSEGRMRR